MPLPAVILLGPQTPTPSLRGVVDDLCKDRPKQHPVAAITAGWQEAEGDLDELDRHLHRPIQNLELYRRSDEVFDRFPDFRQGLWNRKDLLDRLHAAYRVQLAGALDTVRTLQDTESSDPKTISPYLEDAIDAVRQVDRRHFERISRITAEFDSSQGYGTNPEICRHRDEIREILGSCSALLIAGGHILVLLNRLRIFRIADLTNVLPVIAWSAGAMALSERVVLFHHFPPQGSNDTAVTAAGLGVAPGVVAFPHADRRLDVSNPARMALLARRFAPSLCVTLDPGSQLRWDGEHWRGKNARTLTAAGSLEPMEALCP